MKIAVIGAGVAGLSVAARLAGKGHSVSVFESNSYPGGKLTSFDQEGFRFDAGPSLFTMPSYLDAVFEQSGKDPRAYYDFVRIPISCIYYFNDGIRLKAYSDTNKFAEEVEDKLSVSAKLVKNHFEHSALIYKRTHQLFMERSLHKWSNYFKKDILSALFDLHKLNLHKTMHQANTDQFSDPRMVQLFDRFATYNGSNPYQAPGVLNIIPHLEHNLGTYFPKGGMHEITNSLHQLGVDLGVQFHFNSIVNKIRIENGKVKGIRFNDTDLDFDKVISNADVHPTYKKLLKSQRQPEKALNQERSSSALIFYWGMNQSFPELDLHNIFFSGDYKKEFDTLFVEKSISDDPTVYINISSKYNHQDAPKGKENWFVMVNAPANENQDWDNLINHVRELIIKKVSHLLKKDVRSMILNESVLDPRGIEFKTSSYQGSLYGTSSNTKFAAFLRHPNFSQKIKGLYFCGGSVHPGGGIPLCLQSGKIVSELIE